MKRAVEGGGSRVEGLGSRVSRSNEEGIVDPAHKAPAKAVPERRGCVIWSGGLVSYRAALASYCVRHSARDEAREREEETREGERERAYERGREENGRA
eukprot:2709876-Rhodomonas_salina.2